MKLTTVPFILAAMATLTHALVPYPPIPGYSISEPEWEIEVAPNKTILARGTVQQMRKQALAANPDYDAFVQQKQAHRESEPAAELHKRLAQDFNLDHIECEGDFGKVPYMVAQKVVNQVRALEGHPKNGPGPNACQRVSCEEDGAVYWWNDEPYTKYLIDGYGAIADGAMAVLLECSEISGGAFAYRKVAGRAFHTANWNVVVKKDSC
ncbi:hypothetical protein BJX61DRAFT_541743 [Aspergillus egyptiacus]|nr:hypothetical protein BJX61DRAFT_541743 [Aspergillus egyptiacus]